MKKLREFEDYASHATEEIHSANRKELKTAVENVAQIMRARNRGEH